MATRYLTAATLKSYLRSELTLEDTAYEASINAAELWIDNKLGRRMEVASASSARVFTPRGQGAQSNRGPLPQRNSTTLFINDCTTITSVTENGTVLVSGVDYQAEPLNGLSDSGEPRPFHILERLNAGYISGWYTYGKVATVSVNAAWGWAAIPASIVEMCKIVAKDFFEQRDVSHGVIGVSDVGGVGTRENRLVRDAIQQYRHPNSWGIA